MKEYMLLIRNHGDQKAAMPAGEHEKFVRECEAYITRLQKERKLIAAQPLLREGKILYGKAGNWQTKNVDTAGEIQVGYYHILAHDLAEAETIARQNPEFAYTESASIEIRPVKAGETQTGYEYPTDRRIL